MKYLCLLLLLSFGFTVRAQLPYQAIIPGRTAAFSNGKAMLQLRMDSAQIGSVTSYYWNYKSFIPVNQSNEFVIDSPGWTGDYIVEHATQDIEFVTHTNIFHIETGKSIGDKWVFTNLPAKSFLQAEVVRLSFDHFLGLSDSVKYIRLQARDSSGNILPHLLNNKELRLSRSYGLLDVFDFQYLPEDSSVYTLTGFSNPETGFYNLHAKRVFDIHQGDIRHIQTGHTWTPFSFPGDILNYRIRTCLMRQELNNGQLIVITDSVKNIQIHFNQPLAKYDTTYTEYLSKDSILLRDFLFLDKLEYEPTDSPLYAQNAYCYTVLKNLHSFPVPDRVKHRIPLSYAQNAWYYPIDYSPLIYIEALGGPFELEYAIMGDVYYILPVYYKHGNETWGNANTWKLLLNTASVMSENNYRIYPNPSNDYFNIQLDNPSTVQGFLQLYTIEGLLLRTQELKDAETRISLSGLPAGCYLVRIQNGEKTFCTKLLKK